MRDVWDVLRERELKLLTVKKELEALLLVAPLLGEESDRTGSSQPDKILWKDATTGRPVKAWP
jgi:hypothetical protein